jgi:hypothetical protein
MTKLLGIISVAFNVIVQVLIGSYILQAPDKNGSEIEQYSSYL